MKVIESIEAIWKKSIIFKIIIIAIILGIGIGGMKLKDSIAENKERDKRQSQTYEWPETGLATKLPKPTIKYGNIDVDSESYFMITLYKCSEEDYQNYIEKCKKNGFTVDYYSHTLDDVVYYRADDNDGYNLSTTYYLENDKYGSYDAYSLEIRISSPGKEETEETESTNTEPAEQTKTTSNDDFKAAMDSYENTINQYVEFMKKYNSASASDQADMLKEYTEMMQSYTDTMNKLSKLDDSEMSDEQLEYYIEVQTRINKKLLEITE